jgi:hypothetical protein
VICNIVLQEHIGLILGFIVFQNANTPMLNSKLPHLKNLEIRFASLLGFSSSYDVFSLVSFIDASPALEFFILRVSHYPYLSDLSMVLMFYTWLLED